ncbi:MAG: class I SAM-dependent methyltransferase [Congregibacter sp.]
MAKHDPNQAWQNYWRENRLAACVPDNPDTAADIEAHWTEFLAGLPNGTRVLDIATGNGVVLLWAARAARSTGREMALTGIDFADIDPARFLPAHQAELSSVQFIGNTRAESLPFANASFDVVVSQYGLEYADLQQALTEAARVLVSGGQLHCLAHGDDSVVVRQGRAQLLDIDLLLAAHGPFAAMQAYLEAHARGRKVERATRVLTEALRVAEAHCAASPPATLVHQLCGGILDTANRIEQYHVDDISTWLTENRKRLRGQRQRIHDLQAARLSETRLAALKQSLDRPPWSEAMLTSLDVGAHNESVGRLIHAVKG